MFLFFLCQQYIYIFFKSFLAQFCKITRIQKTPFAGEWTCLITALLSILFFSTMTLWSRTHLPNPLSNSITFFIARVTTFDLYQVPDPLHFLFLFVSPGNFLFVSGSFPVPFNSTNQEPPFMAWPALLWKAANGSETMSGLNLCVSWSGDKNRENCLYSHFIFCSCA